MQKSYVHAQVYKNDSLEAVVYKYNNSQQYDSAILLLNNTLATSTNAKNSFHTCIILGNTYKRLFDYTSTKLYIDSAVQYAKQIPNNDAYLQLAQAHYAYIEFDICHYDNAKKIIEQLKKSNYRSVEPADKAKLIMQDGYLNYLSNHFAQAQALYNESLLIMDIVSPCDKPIVYGKQIELYIKWNKPQEAQVAFNKGLHIADSCHIIKYTMYLYQMMFNANANKGNFDLAYKYQLKYDSMHSAYKEYDYLLESNKLLTNQKELHNNIMLANKDAQIAKRNLLIATLLFVLTIGALSFYIFRLLSKRRMEAAKAKQQRLFTHQLIENIETERQRIASDLHDGVNHDLLILRNNVSNQLPIETKNVDDVIQNIRQVSKDLYPAMFEQSGLEQSIHSLCDTLSYKTLFTTADINYVVKLPLQIELNIYRIIQEALNNVIKHAKADAAKVELTNDANHCLLIIKDNGKGFDTASMQSMPTFGLNSIQQRSIYFGAHCTIVSSTKGTIITIEKKYV